MQEQAGLTSFPDAKGVPEREISSDPQLNFNGLGRLKGVTYRVGFQVQRELRNQFEPWLRVPPPPFDCIDPKLTLLAQYYKAKIETADGRQVAQLTYRVVNGNYLEDFHEDLQMSEYGGQVKALLHRAVKSTGIDTSLGARN